MALLNQFFNLACMYMHILIQIIFEVINGNENPSRLECSVIQSSVIIIYICDMLLIVLGTFRIVSNEHL